MWKVSCFNEKVHNFCAVPLYYIILFQIYRYYVLKEPPELHSQCSPVGNLLRPYPAQATSECSSGYSWAAIILMVRSSLLSYN